MSTPVIGADPNQQRPATVQALLGTRADCLTDSLPDAALPPDRWPPDQPPDDSYDLDDLYDVDGSYVPRYLDEEDLYDDLPPMSRVDWLDWQEWAGVEQDKAELEMLRLKAPAWVFLPPGAELAAELEKLRPQCESPTALIEAMKAAARMESWAASIRTAAQASFVRQRRAQLAEIPRPTQIDSTGRPIDPERSWTAEIAAALHLSPNTAARHIDTALHLTGTLTATHTALRCGALTFSKALAISEATRALPPAAAQAVEAHVLRRAAGQTHRNLNGSLRRQVAKHTIREDTDRHRAAIADRTCKIVPLADGMAGLWVVHTADKIQQMWIVIQAMADLAKRATPTNGHNSTASTNATGRATGGVNDGAQGNGSTNASSSGCASAISTANGSANNGAKGNGITNGVGNGNSSASATDDANLSGTTNCDDSGRSNAIGGTSDNGNSNGSTIDDTNPTCSTTGNGNGSGSAGATGGANRSSGGNHRTSGETSTGAAGNPAGHHSATRTPSNQGTPLGRPAATSPAEPGDLDQPSEPDEPHDVGKPAEPGAPRALGAPRDLNEPREQAELCEPRALGELGELRELAEPGEMAEPGQLSKPCEPRAPGESGEVTRDQRLAPQRRADVMAELFEHMLHNGLDWLGRRLPDRHRRRPHIEVLTPITTLLGMDDDPCELTGYGPIPAEMARHIATDGTWRRLLTDPTNGVVLEASTTRHDPGALVTETLLARHPVCAWPGCNRTSRECDRDHGTPFARTGTTSLAGLAPFCEYHHVVKDTKAWAWSTTNHPDGSVTLTAPTGHRYTTVPPARGPITQQPLQPPPDPPPY